MNRRFDCALILGASLAVAAAGLVAAPLGAAYCEINVTGKGVKALEDDYLPHVITCENGGANLEALKAQAIAARSVAYYNMATKGSICDGQGCQVYSCGAGPQAKHFQAVKDGFISVTPLQPDLTAHDAMAFVEEQLVRSTSTPSRG